MADELGIHVSHGALVKIQKTMARELAGLYERLMDQVRAADAVHADDTLWPIDGRRRQLWVFLSKVAAVYLISDTRGKRAIEDALGQDFAGTVITDFYPSFKNLSYEVQKCLVHLLREIHRFEAKPDFEPDPEWKRVRMRVKRLVNEAVAAHETLEDPVDRQAAKARFVKRARAIATLPKRHKYAKTLADLVGTYQDQLFAFLDHAPGQVPWENNPAERGLRRLVAGRKASYGSKSEAGADHRAMLESIAETARLRDLSFRDVVLQEVTALGPSTGVG